MFSNDFVVCIIHNGRVCDESKDGVVALPYGTEYKIRLRNKHNRRAVAKLKVDDENVSKGGIVVPANGYLDVEGPVDSRRNFKFVSETSHEAAIAGKGPRSDGANGVVRVEWQLEKIPEYVTRSLHKQIWGVQPCRDYGLDKEEYTCTSFAPPSNSLGKGCTVQGSYSGQDWKVVHFDVENGAPVVLQLVLRGYRKDENVVSANYCPDCGSKIKRSHKFCSQCGGSLCVV